jgi:hypothetical protein
MRGGAMKIVEACSKAFCLVVVVLFACISAAQAQDIFSEMDQVKREVADLKNQVQDLRNLLFEMRNVLLRDATGQSRKTETGAPAEKEQEAKEEPLPDEEQMTKVICQAVGEFFQEVDTVMRGGDSLAAKEGMRKAAQKLNSKLQRYSGTHRASKLLNIYEGLAWDTYTAVELRQSVAGNEDFIRVLGQHRQKYLDTCPKR